MKDFDDLAIAAESSLRETMVVIDRAAVEIALVLDHTGRLIGTVTDGDIRRAIIRGSPLDTPAAEVMTREFTFVGPETSPQEVLNLMQARGIRQCPVLDSQRRLIGLHLLQDLIGTKDRPNWAVIMAGGVGRRLLPLTENVPKPMLMVEGRPLLERTVTQLVAHGFRRIFLSIHYLGDQIVRYFGDGKKFGCSIEYLSENKPLGTGGALSLLPEKPTHPLLVINGDLLTEVNFSALFDYHVHNEYPATMCVKEFKYQVPYGVVHLKDHQIVEIDEKPSKSFLINAGIYVLEPDALRLLPDNGQYDLPQLIDALQRQKSPVGAFPIREQWIDIGRLEDYYQAQSFSQSRESEI